MKITTKISALLLLFLTTFSCDDLDELTEFDITDDFSTTINISVTEDSEGQPQSISQSSTLDITTNEEIEDNLDLIQDISVNELTYEITNYSGVDDAILSNASLTFGSSSISISNINLQQSDIDNTVYTINDTSIINAVASNLENNSMINMSVSGTVSATPVVFDVLIYAEITTTIDVL
ncbi:hypothetical protein HNV10_08165 [Winogradskyella litoriviva]|uniref:Uncharacterized protein n=1 Tax=Winogradskyella litoriviva TaxID=1220182 RepID=A0ABX2E555_9FLAO|nr:hypothetical protein [Winogradskyella litoriviva]NRD23212.1 hypothetical protein [Winogradskyella litoriviva]